VVRRSSENLALSASVERFNPEKTVHVIIEAYSRKSLVVPVFAHSFFSFVQVQEDRWKVVLAQIPGVRHRPFASKGNQPLDWKWSRGDWALAGGNSPGLRIPLEPDGTMVPL
jgi:hypothetical protein